MIQTEAIGQQLEELLYGDERIEDVNGENIGPELLQSGLQRRRLSAANLAGHNDEPLVVFDPILEIRHHFDMALRLEEIPRIWRQSERHFFQPIKLRVHL